MSTKLITPWKRSNSAFYWFRMVVPLRYRTTVGKSEIKQSLGTSDLGDARRLCAQAQAQWLDQFREIETRQQQAAAIEGVEIVDRYLYDQADLRGGLSAVMSYKLQDFALSEAAMLILNDEREDEFGHDPSLDTPTEQYRASAAGVRLVEIFGDIDVTEIDSGMVMDFRDAMRGLPSRPKRAVAELPLLEQIEVARRDELPTLAGPTIGKLLSGLLFAPQSHDARMLAGRTWTKTRRCENCRCGHQQLSPEPVIRDFIAAEQLGAR